MSAVASAYTSCGEEAQTTLTSAIESMCVSSDHEDLSQEPAAPAAPTDDENEEPDTAYGSFANASPVEVQPSEEAPPPEPSVAIASEPIGYDQTHSTSTVETPPAPTELPTNIAAPETPITTAAASLATDTSEAPESSSFPDSVVTTQQITEGDPTGLVAAPSDSCAATAQQSCNATGTVAVFTGKAAAEGVAASAGLLVLAVAAMSWAFAEL
ncbi:hypothetical protein WHR41_08273 [Cladosporium halotolerans]|uniref:Uncharacterized protein n=1 Tax=Cladosporium halotolerans TaxID=1052096 RepID=A0AB34KDC8_9PEZI